MAPDALVCTVGRSVDCRDLARYIQVNGQELTTQCYCLPRMTYIMLLAVKKQTRRSKVSTTSNTTSFLFVEAATHCLARIALLVSSQSYG